MKIKMKFSAVFTAVLIMIAGCSAPQSSPQYTAKEIAVEILGSSEFPKMTELSSEQAVEYIDLDMAYVEDVAFYWQSISVELAEVLIIIPKSGMEEKAYDFAKARCEKRKNDTTFYPSQELAADAAVFGQKGNVVYYICNYDAAKAEEALVKLLG